ncbi:MAG: TPM domain-containing protein [Alphaproteobacteria bacterium]|nr:TPM domain-containing protein [Alphaproteobacteria bacterium]
MRALRRILAVILLLAAATAAAQQLRVPPLARVVDVAGVLSVATREQLTRLLAEHEKRSSNQIVVVTLPSLEGLDIAEAGLQLGRAWKLGTKQNSNGVLLVVAPNERKLRIEVGYGLEGNLPDARAFQIINGEIVPRFRAGDIEGGIVKGTLAIIASVEGSYQPPKSADGPLEGQLVPILFVVGMGLIVLFVVYRNGGGLGGGHGPSPYGRRGGPWGRGPMVILPPSRGGWSGGGGGRGGGWSGGGGSFGGGGATGSW